MSGYNFSDEIIYYGLDFYYYTSPGYLSKDRVRESIKFKVKNRQFLELYDADGREITGNFKNQESAGDRGSSIAKAELFMLYVYIAIVMGVGFIITRYFLTE